MANDELMRLADEMHIASPAGTDVHWKTLRRFSDRLRALAQRAPQSGAVPKGWRIRKDGDEIGIMAPKAIPGALRLTPRDLEDPGMFDSLPGKLLYALAEALLAADPAPEARQPDGYAYRYEVGPGTPAPDQSPDAGKMVGEAKLAEAEQRLRDIGGNPKPSDGSTSKRYGTNTGHGHVWQRPDGVKARCGGPNLCIECHNDLMMACGVTGNAAIAAGGGDGIQA